MKGMMLSNAQAIEVWSCGVESSFGSLVDVVLTMLPKLSGTVSKQAAVTNKTGVVPAVSDGLACGAPSNL